MRLSFENDLLRVELGGSAIEWQAALRVLLLHSDDRNVSRKARKRAGILAATVTECFPPRMVAEVLVYPTYDLDGEDAAVALRSVFHYIEHVHGADANGRRIDKQFQPTLTAWYVQGKDWIDSIRDAHPQIAIMLGSSAVEAGIAYCPIRQ